MTIQARAALLIQSVHTSFWSLTRQCLRKQALVSWIARTIADLDGQDWIQVGHLNEAINYRLLDRKM